MPSRRGADFREQVDVVREVVVDRAGARREQSDRVGLVLWVRVAVERQRWHEDRTLRRHTQALTTGREHCDPRARCEQTVDERRDHVEHVLTVVEHEECGPALQVLEQRRFEVLARLLGDRERGGHRLGEELFAHGDEIDERRATGNVRRGVGHDGHREPGLAHASRTHQRHEPALTQRVQHLGALASTPDERRGDDGSTDELPTARIGRAVLSGPRRERATVVGTELPQQGRDVALNGSDRYVEALGDLGVRQVLAQQREHVLFTRRDRVRDDGGLH